MRDLMFCNFASKISEVDFPATKEPLMISNVVWVAPFEVSNADAMFPIARTIRPPL
jgi:hypothetical protein